MVDRQNTKWLMTAFFMDRDGKKSERSLVEWARRAGMQTEGELETNPFLRSTWSLVHGAWGGLPSTWAKLDVLEFHDCLQIYFWGSLFHDLNPGGTEAVADDPAYPLALTFRDACLNLPASVGFISTHPYEANYAALLDLYVDVFAYSGFILSRSNLGLLYLDARTAEDFLARGDFAERDRLSVPAGCLVFARRGPRRWW